MTKRPKNLAACCPLLPAVLLVAFAARGAEPRGVLFEHTLPSDSELNDGRYRELHDRQYAWEANRFVNPGEDY